jgi:hypothetical protein
MTVMEAIFTKFTFGLQHFVRNSINKFYENSINILVTDTRSQLDNQWDLRTDGEHDEDSHKTLLLTS